MICICKLRKGYLQRNFFDFLVIKENLFHNFLLADPFRSKCWEFKVNCPAGCHKVHFMPVRLTSTLTRYYFILSGYPVGYSNNMDCVWVITAPHHVQLTIVSLTMERDKGEYCAFDSLTIYDGKE